MQRMLGVKRVFLTIGVHDEDGAKKKEVEIVKADGTIERKIDDKTTVALVATVHEYGLGTSPERSFLRAWHDENRGKNLEAFRKIYKAVIAEKYDVKTGLDRLGLHFVAQIQNRIARGIEPALKDATIKRKKSSKPLINTGQLRSSIRHRLDFRKK